MPATDTARAVIDGARSHLYRGHRDERTRLSVALGTGDTSATFDFPRGGIQDGAKLSIDIEDINVWTAPNQSAVSAMERGAYGTAPAAHTAGTPVVINAVVSDAELFAALNDELATLSAEGLFRIVGTDITYAASTVGYGLPADFLDVYEVRWKLPGTTKDWVLVLPAQYSVSRDLSATDFSTGGNALLLHIGLPPSAMVRLRYKASFNPLAALSDVVVTASGLHAEALPLLVVGTALRVAAGRPLRRAHINAQGSPRRAEEVSTTDVLAAAGGLRQMRRDLLRAEVSRLNQRWPTRL